MFYNQVLIIALVRGFEVWTCSTLLDIPFIVTVSVLSKNDFKVNNTVFLKSEKFANFICQKSQKKSRKHQIRKTQLNASKPLKHQKFLKFWRKTRKFVLHYWALAALAVEQLPYVQKNADAADPEPRGDSQLEHRRAAAAVVSASFDRYSDLVSDVFPSCSVSLSKESLWSMKPLSL